MTDKALRPHSLAALSREAGQAKTSSRVNAKREHVVYCLPAKAILALIGEGE